MTNIKKLRLDKGLTQRQLCMDIGLKTTLYGLMENGKQGINYETMQALSAYYGVPISELI